MEKKILFVDDEVNILNAFKRRLRIQYNFETCSSSKEALKKVSEEKDFAVIISDMTMPEMNGADLLAKVKKISPQTVRVMLTGNADQQTATVAVNNAGVFRFVNKPCSIEEIIAVIDDALKQHKLITAEKELLQNTLSGSVKLLTDLLGFLNPVSFGSTLNYRETVRAISSKLEIANSWDIELAMMLSDIGTFMVPKELLEKSKQNLALSEIELKMLEKIPETGKKLISNIPRLEKVAEAIYFSQKNYDGSGFPDCDVKGEDIAIAARIIHIIKDYDFYLQNTMSPQAVFEMLESKKGFYDPKILQIAKEVIISKAFKEGTGTETETETFEVTIKQLCPGQIVLADIYTNDDVLLVKRGAEISETMIHRISNYGAISGIKAPILVDCLMPTE